MQKNKSDYYNMDFNQFIHFAFDGLNAGQASFEISNNGNKGSGRVYSYSI